MAFVTYEVSVEMANAIAPVLADVARHDKDLANQMRRSAASVVLNINEGAKSTRGNETLRFENAAGSASETRAALQVATAWGYITEERRLVVDTLLDRLIGLLWGLTHRGRRNL